MARARWGILPCLILLLALGGCKRLFTSEGTPSAAKTRVRFILQTIKDHGNDTSTELQTAICRWDSDLIVISDRDELGQALDAFDAWRKLGNIYPTLHSFEVDDKVEDRRANDPENTYYVAVKIDGVPRHLRVPPKARLRWVDG
jgi:hypothetical protein